MKQDRFLTGILIGIGMLVVLALVIFFVRNREVTYSSENTPQAVVHNYVLAIQKREYERAYTYLIDKEGKPTLDSFRTALFADSTGMNNVGVEIGEVLISNDQANVSITLLYSSRGITGSVGRNQEAARLVNSGGGWKITFMPGPYWRYDWYPVKATPTSLNPPGK